MKKQVMFSLFVLFVFAAGWYAREAKDSGNACTERIGHLETRVKNLFALHLDLALDLEGDPHVLLYRMDRDLDAVELGENPDGSFTDSFVPNAAMALEAGATREEVNARIERVIALAEKGKMFSSFLEEIFRAGGPTAVRDYVAGWIRRVK